MEFGRQIEYVGLDLVPQLLPLLNPKQQNALEAQLQADGAYELSNQFGSLPGGLVWETTVEGGIGRNIFMRGGYTYLDAVVQRSFTNDDVRCWGHPNLQQRSHGIPIGSVSPLQGARPFRRAPHTGFFTATYATRRLTGVFHSAFASPLGRLGLPGL